MTTMLERLDDMCIFFIEVLNDDSFEITNGSDYMFNHTLTKSELIQLSDEIRNLAESAE